MRFSSTRIPGLLRMASKAGSTEVLQRHEGRGRFRIMPLVAVFELVGVMPVEEKGMRVLLFGATGMIVQGVLRDSRNIRPLPVASGGI